MRSGAKQHQAALKALPHISKAPSQPSTSPLTDALCDTSRISNIPYNVFYPGVVSKFCDTISGGDKGEGLTQIVDSNGNVIPSRKIAGPSESIEKRTPPADPDVYTGYTFALQWTGGNGSCSSECGTIYEAISSDICVSMSFFYLRMKRTRLKLSFRWSYG